MKEDIIRMAQACWPSDRRMWAVDADLPRLERFFHMAQAAEREARSMRWDELIAKAVLAEREACARIAWNFEPDENGPIETAIRARGQV
jgi:hypothetical protein